MFAKLFHHHQIYSIVDGFTDNSAGLCKGSHIQAAVTVVLLRTADGDTAIGCNIYGVKPRHCSLRIKQPFLENPSNSRF